ncbi:MAG TPA: hypothetical protein PLD54_02985, partial [Candidatus Levybacteria bacterium]|nr:hypothetical protein [Candidatus Levybacteria bacterium]
MVTTRRVLIVSLILGIITMLSGIGLILHQRTSQPSTTELPIVPQQTGIISGTFDINGIIPDDATITLTKRDFTSSNSQTAATNIIPVDEGTWSLTDVDAGKSYEIIAKVTVGAQTIFTSAPVTITAPASNVVLSINLPLTQPQSTAVISGTVRVNGYIPSGSTIAVQGRKLGDPQFQPIVQNLPGEQRQFMSYTTAIGGQTYEVYGILYDRSKKQIGSSQVLVLTAPALNETLTINSQAVVPSPTATVQTPTPIITQTVATATPAPMSPTPTPITLSGSINFNGIAPINSRIVILQKVYNTPNYQVAVDNITPIDGTTWTWTGANAAT